MAISFVTAGRPCLDRRPVDWPYNNTPYLSQHTRRENKNIGEIQVYFRYGSLQDKYKRCVHIGLLLHLFS